MKISEQKNQKNKSDNKIEFNLFFQKYSYIIRRLLASKIYDYHKHEDAYQEILIKIYKNFDQIKSSTSKYKYLYMLIQNYVFDYLRSKEYFIDKNTMTLDTKMSCDDNDYFGHEIIVNENLYTYSEIEKIDNNFSIQQITKAFNILSATEKQVITLIDIDDLNYKQVSEKLKINITTVKSRLYHARDKIKKYLYNMNRHYQKY